MAIVIEGILKRGSQRRAYLVVPGRGKAPTVLRLRPPPEFRSGESITVVGRLEGRHLTVEQATLRQFPVRRTA